MKTNELFIQQWKEVRPHGMLAPSRKDIKPSSFIGYLPFIALLERISAREITVRLAGTGLEDWFRLYLKGKNSLDFVVEDQRERVSELYKQMAQTMCGMWGKRVFVNHDGCNFNCEVTILPLIGDCDDRPCYLSWYNLKNIDKYNLTEIEPTGYGYDELKFIDLGNGLPKVDVRSFQNNGYQHQ